MRTVMGLALVGGLCLLAACGGDAQSMQGQDPIVSVRYTDGGEDQAQANAQDYCDDKYDRDAALVSRGEQQGVMIATYQCVTD